MEFKCADTLVVAIFNLHIHVGVPHSFENLLPDET